MRVRVWHAGAVLLVGQLGYWLVAPMVRRLGLPLTVFLVPSGLVVVAAMVLLVMALGGLSIGRPPRRDASASRVSGVPSWPAPVAPGPVGLPSARVPVAASRTAAMLSEEMLQGATSRGDVVLSRPTADGIRVEVIRHADGRVDGLTLRPTGWVSGVPGGRDPNLEYPERKTR